MNKKNLATICALSLTIPMTLYAPVVKAAPNLVPNMGNEMQPPQVETPPVQQPERVNPPEERPEQPENPEPSVGDPNDSETTPAPAEPKPEPQRPDPKPEEKPTNPEPKPEKPTPNDSGTSPEPKPKPEPKPSDPKPKKEEQSAATPSGDRSQHDGIIIADAGGTDGDQGGKGDGNTADSAEKAAETKEPPQTKDDKMVQTAVGADQVSLLISLIGATLTLGILLLRFAPAIFRRETA